MTKKIFYSITFISSFAVISAIIIISAFLHIYSRESAKEKLINEGNIIASAVEMNGEKYLEETDFGNIRVTWIDPQGYVIFDTVKNPEHLGNHIDRLEVTEALENGEGIFLRYSDTVMQTTLNYAKKLSDESIIRVSALHNSFAGQISKLINPMILILVIFVIISMIFASLTAKHIVKPINSIDLDNPNIKSSYKELAPLLKKLKIQNRKVNRQFKELNRSREQFSLITENMDEGLIIADSKAMILVCNSATLRLLDTEKSRNSQSIFSLNNSEPFRRCINDAMGGRHSEFILKTDGGERQVIASPANSHEIMNGIVVFILDVTEQQKLETMRKEFTSNVSHELKTPLTTIYGISDMLSNGMVRSEDVCSFGENIKDEAGRMIALINDIIALSKLDENSVPEQNEPVDIYSLSEEIMKRLEKSAEEKNISCSLSGGHVTVIGNRTVLSEIIYNLCDNAIKYNIPEGRYEVRISHIPKKAFITVSDTGIGIPPEHIERIFERFYRADKSHSRKIKGTGLGLSIVKHGVMYSGGTVKAESTVGKGSVFTVELPVK